MEGQQTDLFERLIRLEERQRNDHETVKVLTSDMRLITASLVAIQASVSKVELTLNGRIDGRMWAICGAITATLASVAIIITALGGF